MRGDIYIMAGEGRCQIHRVSYEKVSGVCDWRCNKCSAKGEFECESGMEEELIRKAHGEPVSHTLDDMMGEWGY